MGDKIVVVGRPGRRQAGPPDRGLRRQELEGRGRHSRRRASTSAAASDGRYVYAVGGRNLAPDKNSPALERYDPGSDSWTKLPDMPTASGSVAAAVVGGRLITVGGETPTQVSAAVQAYDMTKKRWSTLPPMHTAASRRRAGRDRRLALRDRRRDRTRARGIDPQGRGSRPQQGSREGALTIGRKWRELRNAPFARQYAAATAVRGSGVGVRRVGGHDLEHHGEGVRPGDQRVEDGARACRCRCTM